MATFETTVETDQPQDEVFAYLSDLSRFGEWDPGIKSAQQVEGEGPGVGAVYDIVAGVAKLRYEVTSFVAPTQLVAVGKDRIFTSTDTISVATVAGKTVVTYHADLVLGGLLRIFDPLLGVVFDRIGDKAAEGLTAKLEGRRLS